jgi:hypothetical protein
MRRALLGSALLLLLAPATAAASGPPPSTTNAEKGIVALGGGVRYTAQRQGGSTLVKRLAEPRGRVQRARTLAGRWGVPAVALDGTASGLSADGRTLVLAAARNDVTSARRTRLLVLDAATLGVRQRVELRGAFGFDGISPDGDTLYLIGYRSTGNPTDYAVRAYDVSDARLLAKPIVDPREPDEKMTGLPLTRVTSRDGAWDYTLYAGNDKPFVHALDTAHRTARCIDLDGLAGAGDYGALRLRLSADGRRLSALEGPTVLNIVDTRTFKVSSPHATPVPQPVPPAPKPAPAPVAADSGGSSFPWALLGGIAAALVLAAAAVTVAARRYAGSASPE